METNDVWTRSRVINKLDNSNKAVFRAVHVIFNNQTQDEQTQETAGIINGVGFNKIDAPFMSRMHGLMMKKDYAFSEAQINAIRKTVKKYWKQLLGAAERNGKTVSYDKKK